MRLTGLFDRRLSRAARPFSQIGARGAVWHPTGSLPLLARCLAPPVLDGARRRLGRPDSLMFAIEHKMPALCASKRCRTELPLLARASPPHSRLLEAELTSSWRELVGVTSLLSPLRSLLL